LTTTFTAKYPYDGYAISFNFLVELGAEIIAGATLTAIDQSTLEDASATVLDATKQVYNAALVYGWVRNGEADHNYLISCQIIGSLGSQYELDGILPVRSASTATAAIDIIAFRQNFPEFADTTKYPDAMLTFWSSIGDKQLNVRKWGTLRDQGLMLLTAHYAVLAAQNASSLVPGENTGVITSESAGGVSVSMDTSSVVEQDAGLYNRTTYGSMFIRLTRIVGIGGRQL
jgi:hypothetical protein